MDRSQLAQSPCWTCFEREGGHCFSTRFGSVPKNPDKKWEILGWDITEEHIAKCKEVGAYLNKRRVWEQIIPGDMLVFTSESAKKK